MIVNNVVMMIDMLNDDAEEEDDDVDRERKLALVQQAMPLSRSQSEPP